MALGTFAVGPHTVTFGGNAVGLTEGPIELGHIPLGEEVRADRYGQAIIDYIELGINCFARLTFKEWNAYVRGVIYPYSATMGTPGLAGRLLSDVAAALVITPVASTPAATAGSTTIIASKAIALPGTEITIPMGSVQRHIPVTFALLPYDDSGTIRHYVLS